MTFEKESVDLGFALVVTKARSPWWYSSQVSGGAEKHTSLLGAWREILMELKAQLNGGFFLVRASALNYK